LGFSVDLEEVAYSGKRVVVCHIPSRPSGIAYHRKDGRYLIRVGSSLVTLTNDQLTRIHNEPRRSRKKNLIAGAVGALLFLGVAYFVWYRWRPKTVTVIAPSEQHETKDSVTVSKQPSLPSFVFACCAIVVNNNSWDFVLKHQGDKEIESIDVLFQDEHKLEAIRESTPPQAAVNPTDYSVFFSVFFHVDKMYPKGLGSLFAKQFIWKPDSLGHGKYSLNISASTGRFHEDLYVESVGGEYTNAAKVQEIGTKAVLFVCRDHDFPKALAPEIKGKNNCFPDWLKQ
jgi:hypothetical protein